MNDQSFKDFPNILTLVDGTTISRDQSRLLLWFKAPHTLQQVEALLLGPFSLPTNQHLVLETTTIVMERGSLVGPGGNSINHTTKRFWVRSQSGKAIDSQMVTVIESAPQLDLERTGPVYKIHTVSGQDALVCPLPNVSR